MVKMVKSSYAWELREGFGSSGKSRSLLQYIDFRPLCYFDFLLPDFLVESSSSNTDLKRSSTTTF